MLKEELSSFPPSNDAPVFRSELSNNPSSSASATGSNVISSNKAG